MKQWFYCWRLAEGADREAGRTLICFQRSPGTLIKKETAVTSQWGGRLCLPLSRGIGEGTSHSAVFEGD